jgi:hypothetical protein
MLLPMLLVEDIARDRFELGAYTHEERGLQCQEEKFIGYHAHQRVPEAGIQATPMFNFGILGPVTPRTRQERHKP